MKTELVTIDQAESLGLVHSRLLHEGYGAFGEPDNSYEDVVYLDGKAQRVSNDDLILFQGKSPNMEIIQIIDRYDCSDKLLEILNPEALIKKKKEKFQKYLELKKEIESDDFYKPKPTSLEGCPFNYCDSNPKCEGKCRYV